MRKTDDVAASVAQLTHLVLEKERKTLEHLKKLEATCPPGYQKYREVCYKAIVSEETFSGSEKVCQSDGGTLAMPRDAGINGFLFFLKNREPGEHYFWFGLHYRRQKGKWEWIDGTPLGTGYSSWKKDFPMFHDNDPCAIYQTTGDSTGRESWGNSNCEHRNSFICEYIITGAAAPNSFSTPYPCRITSHLLLYDPIPGTRSQPITYHRENLQRTLH
ncbi:hypothetical protein Bbelb_252980 [Branchiostoma belcheri]|nr:hypothetical protein Bbelb_252980 [Branchiostoma belcheri]